MLFRSLILRSNSYANAEGWDDLIHAFVEPLKNSSLDEIILLLHTATPGPDAPQPKHACQVFYNQLGEVPELLLSRTPSALRTDTTPTDEWWPPVRAATGVHPDNGHGGGGPQKRIQIPEERIMHGKEVEEAMPGDDHEEEIDKTQVNAAKVIQDAYHRHLEQKRARAARKIQVAYRRHLKGKAVVHDGIDATQARYWHLLHRRSMEMEWPKNSRYYLLFRVPLGYILVCLDTIKAFIELEKKQAKKRMMTEDHGGLEELMEALNQYKYVARIPHYIKGLINPSANSSKERSRFRKSSPLHHSFTRGSL